MKAIRKLALVSAIASLPVAGHAMQAMDDAALSGVTGQDGIMIELGLNQTLDLLVEDTTGLNGANSTLTGMDNAGGILIKNMKINGNASVSIDSAGDGAGNGVLVVGVNVTGLNLETGDIHIVDMGRAADTNHQAADDALATAAFGSSTAPVLDSMTITASNLGLEVQLGDGAENLLQITNGNLGTITIADFGLNDVAGGGKLGVENITVANLDVSGTRISIEDGTGANAEGIRVALGGSIGRVTLDNVTAGGSTAGSFGNIYVNGLTLNNTVLSITGK